MVRVSVTPFVLAVVTPFVLVACGGDECETPPDVGYDCEPQTDSVNACVGGPTIDGVQHDPDRNYPIGCSAGPARCEGGDLVVEPQCECLSGFTGVTWACTP